VVLRKPSSSSRLNLRGSWFRETRGGPASPDKKMGRRVVNGAAAFRGSGAPRRPV
jgi:hypothetical protein